MIGIGDMLDSTDGEERTLGISEMIKAFIGQNKFSVKYKEDLDDIIQTFESYATMCGMSKTDS